VYLIDVHLKGVRRLIGMYLMGMHLVGMCLMGMYLRAYTSWACVLRGHPTDVYPTGVHIIHPPQALSRPIVSLDASRNNTKGSYTNQRQ
jgi:hypothetical protein